MTYRLPSLNTLRAFEAAGRHLSFQAAAYEIGVTSGAVSQQVRKLERSLGVDLFQRLPHGLLLTPQGRDYLPKITAIFEKLTDATEEIAPDINGKKFSVGVCPDAAALLPKGWPLGGYELEAFVRERVGTSDPEQVNNGTIDCLISLVDETTDGTLKAIKVGPYRFLCKESLAHCRQTEALLSCLSVNSEE